MNLWKSIAVVLWFSSSCGVLAWTSQEFDLKAYFCVMSLAHYRKVNEKDFYGNLLSFYASKDSVVIRKVYPKFNAHLLRNCYACVDKLSERNLAYKLKDLISKEPVIRTEIYLFPIKVVKLKGNYELNSEERSILQSAENQINLPIVF